MAYWYTGSAFHQIPQSYFLGMAYWYTGSAFQQIPQSYFFARTKYIIGVKSFSQ